MTKEAKITVFCNQYSVACIHFQHDFDRLQWRNDGPILIDEGSSIRGGGRADLRIYSIWHHDTHTYANAPVSQEEQMDQLRRLLAGVVQCAQVDEVHHCLHGLFSGLLDGQLPRGLFRGLRVEHGLEIGRRLFQKAAMHLNR